MIEYTEHERRDAAEKVDALPVWNDNGEEWRSHAIDLQMRLTKAEALLRDASIDYHSEDGISIKHHIHKFDAYLEGSKA